ncbi:MAG TPA: PIN domain-containing protein [Candidatus Paceibacterota bacterium]
MILDSNILIGYMRGEDDIIISIDAETVRAAGALRRAYHLSVPDAVIIATAIIRHIPLATRDKKMRSVPGVELAEV